MFNHLLPPYTSKQSVETFSYCYMFYEGGEQFMQIIKRVNVKQVLTEKSKQKLRDTFEKEIAQLELESQQLLFEKRKLINKLASSKHSIDLRFEKEIRRRKDKKVLIEFKVEQLDLLQLNSEVIEKEVDTLVNVEIGSDWEAISKKQSIIIKDGTVIRIDNE